MFVLVLVLLLLMGGIVLGQLNNQIIDFNFFGVMLHGVPLSLLLMTAVLIGVILTYLSFTIRNLMLKNRLDQERKALEILSKREIEFKNEIKKLERLLAVSKDETKDLEKPLEEKNEEN